jgi:sucrose phosphorylase
MKNQVQLITYVDRLAGSDLAALDQLLRGPLAGVFGGVHLLPFFHPIDGADAGFDPIDHTIVDPRLGDWSDIKKLTEDRAGTNGLEVMADVIVNHMSSDSPQFKDYSAKGAASKYAGLFLTMNRVYPQGATEADLLKVYRPRPGMPFTMHTFPDGRRELLWTTFTAQQIDIDVTHAEGSRYLTEILRNFADNNIRMVRLDAVGYAIKKPGKNCFMMPETFDFIEQFAAQAKALGIEVLVEIHSYYKSQIDIAKKVDWVYDFALPPLVLHSIFFKTARCLRDWIAIRPNNALTVLDTHDGIGIIDVGADAAARQTRPGLVPEAELTALVDRIHDNSKGQSRQATGAAASNLDLYQVNCTFFDALARNANDYLLARAIQFFMPGIPQVYYVGLFAGENDMDLLARSRVGRDINRHYYAGDEVNQSLRKPVVADLIKLIQLRNTHAAFQGSFSCKSEHDAHLRLTWTNGAAKAELDVDFTHLSFVLQATDAQGTLSAVSFPCAK